MEKLHECWLEGPYCCSATQAVMGLDAKASLLWGSLEALAGTARRKLLWDKVDTP